MPAVLDPILGGDTGPVARPKINGNNSRLNTAIAAVEARALLLERQSYAAGVVLGPTPVVFPYATLPAPGSLTSKGMVPIGGIGGDGDGKVCIIPMTATRRAEISVQQTASTSAPAFLCTVYDNVGGVPVVLTSLAFATISGTNVGMSSTCILGGRAISATQMKVMVLATSSALGTYPLYQLTLTLDPGTNTLTATTDAFVQNGSTSFPNNFTHRRRGYSAGNLGLAIPYAFATTGPHFGGTFPGFYILDRAAGSTFRQARAIGGALSVVTYALEKVSDNVFAMLCDGSSTGQTSGATLYLGSLDDVVSGQVAGVRLGNGLAGNVRLTPIAANLIIAGFTTNSTYSTYAFINDGTGWRLLGGSSTAGALGSVPLEILPISATRFVTFVKGAGAGVTFTVYSVDPTAANGVSPFAQASTNSFNLGAGIANFNAADAYVVGAVEPGVTGDFVEFAFRNTTRGVNGLESFGFPTA